MNQIIGLYNVPAYNVYPELMTSIDIHVPLTCKFKKLFLNDIKVLFFLSTASTLQDQSLLAFNECLIHVSTHADFRSLTRERKRERKKRRGKEEGNENGKKERQRKTGRKEINKQISKQK